jgi:hypothetical protein
MPQSKRLRVKEIRVKPCPHDLSYKYALPISVRLNLFVGREIARSYSYIILEVRVHASSISGSIQTVVSADFIVVSVKFPWGKAPMITTGLSPADSFEIPVQASEANLFC